MRSSYSARVSDRGPAAESNGAAAARQSSRRNIRRPAYNGRMQLFGCMSRGCCVTIKATERLHMDIQREIFLKAKPERVWRALADSKEFASWFGDSVEGDFV